MGGSILQPEEHVLSTLEGDGSRRWLKPKLSQGRLLTYRRWLAYLLIVIFTVLPFLKIGGKPVILLDIVARRFTIGGFTFLPTDTVLLAVFMVGLLLSIFLLTALVGRIWCGWACPQTVYMEFVFRPIERWLDGTTGRGGNPKRVAVWRTLVKYAIYLLICFYLANTFLAYFVGVERLWQWVRQSPLEHPIPFLVMAFVTCAMMFDFCFFREQMCIIACPYGRFQSVLLDSHSLIVAYDEQRGEPRTKGKKKDPSLPIVGDCIDCGNCVTTCPTGIDIREGLQMECIHCTQCIDACNIVMKKLDREPDLIRFSSQARDRGTASGWLRPRTIVYPLLLSGIATLFLLLLTTRLPFDAVLLRELGNPYTLTEEDRVRNLLRLKLTNRTEELAQYQVSIVEPSSAEIEIRQKTLELAGQATKTFQLQVVANRDSFVTGRANLMLRVENQDQDFVLIDFKLIGPYD